MAPVLAILIDSVRALRAKKLFWFVLSISAIVVISYGSIGFNKEGFSILYGLKSFKNEYIREGMPYANYMLDMMFATFIIPLWLSWGAIILALISTADIIPEFLADGAIDLVVSKPISRVTIFLTKFVGSLMFVFFQVLIFCVGVFLIYRFRLHQWRWSMFYAIPIVLAVYSYLYAMMALLNVLTRSTLASLLITIIMWLSLFSLQSTEKILNTIRLSNVDRLKWQNTRMEYLTHRMKDAIQDDNKRQIERYKSELDDLRVSNAETTSFTNKISLWHSGFRMTMNVLPKPQETVNLVKRKLQSDENFRLDSIFEVMAGEAPPDVPKNYGNTNIDETPSTNPDLEEDKYRYSDRNMQRDIEEDYKSRSAAFVLCTSLGFEAVILGFACFIFVRKDY